MPDPIETTLAAALNDRTAIGQLLIQQTNSNGFALCHRDDEDRASLEIFRKPEDAIEIARYDNAGTYRSLKTSPSLRHGWRLEVSNLRELQRALDYLYPGRLAMLSAWKHDRLTTTPLRDTLNRQSGMYRVAAKISDEQIDGAVGNFCRSNGGCLRTILWKRDGQETVPSKSLPPDKFDLAHDQTGRGEPAVPLLCQEACNLLVAQCRKIVKAETNQE